MRKGAEVRSYLTRAQFANAKRRLTVAKKKSPEAVIAEVDRTFAEWDAGNYAWPDDWARWQRAKDDAEFALRFGAEPRY